MMLSESADLAAGDGFWSLAILIVTGLVALFVWWRISRRRRQLERLTRRCEATYQQIIEAEARRAGLPRYRVAEAAARTSDDQAWNLAVAETVDYACTAADLHRRGETVGFLEGLIVGGLWNNRTDR